MHIYGAIAALPPAVQGGEADNNVDNDEATNDEHQICRSAADTGSGIQAAKDWI